MTRQREWSQMLARSFHPSDWFFDGFPEDGVEHEGKEGIMWVYRQTERGGHPVWTVGFYSPDKVWHSDRDFSTREEAARRCAWLNGSSKESP